MAGLLVAGSCAISALLRAPQIALADEETTAVKKEPWKPEDFIYGETAGQFRISPDAKWVVWVKTTGDKDKDTRISNLILSSLTASREIPLTRGSDTVSQPRWSPDGEWIAFLSTRARPKAKPDTAPMQIWLVNAGGGEPWPLTELAHAGVCGFSPGARRSEASVAKTRQTTEDTASTRGRNSVPLGQRDYLVCVLRLVRFTGFAARSSMNLAIC